MNALLTAQHHLRTNGQRRADVLLLTRYLAPSYPPPPKKKEREREREREREKKIKVDALV